ncbi:MAG: hypothetical protein K1X94_34315 [Sandaracinaceae bacterium]|nr:hypothetical protein [Sandaracinaceae bacterium]
MIVRLRRSACLPLLLGLAACGGASPPPVASPPIALSPGHGPWPACEPLDDVSAAPPGRFLDDDGAFPDGSASPTEPFAYRVDDGLVVLVPNGDETREAALWMCPIPAGALGSDLLGPDDPPWTSLTWTLSTIEVSASAAALRLEGRVEPSRVFADVSRAQSFVLALVLPSGLETSVLERVELQRPLCWRGCGPFEGDDVVAREGRVIEARWREHPEESDGGAGTDAYTASREIEVTIDPTRPHLHLHASPWTTHRERGFDTRVADDTQDLAPLGAWAQP